MSDSGLTSEDLKQRFAEKSIREASTFRTLGVSEQSAKNYLETSEGDLYLKRLVEASPNTAFEDLRMRAIKQITSGLELPRMETLNEPLVKIVPRGIEPSPYSPFWAKESDLDAAVKEGKNLSHQFALPIASESAQYDVYTITPKAPTEVFVNTVAPTSELGGQVSKPGGAPQYLTPNRHLYEPHTFLKTVENRLHIPLQKAPDHSTTPKNDLHAPVSSHVAGLDGSSVQTTPTYHSRLPSSTVLKGLGVAGTAYGVAQGIFDTSDAIDLAKSNREQWVRGAEAGADVATRGVVTGAAATVGAIPGAAVGTLTSPVTGPVGPVAGALATGGAAAYGADKAYDASRLQTFAKSFGRSVGEMGYDYVSREGRLLREVNGLKQDLQAEADPARRQAIETQLSGANQRFSTEAERNSRYFDGRGAIEKSWHKTHAQFPKLDKDDVTNALSQHIDAGKPATDAAKAAYSDAVHEKYPRALPHQPAENYQTMGNDQLLEWHSTHIGKLVEHRQQAQAHLTNTDSHNNLDQGWPRALAEQRQAGRVESSLNAVWKDTGHVSAIREAMQARGMKPPELPAELQRQRGQDAQPSPAQPAHNARDDLRAHENLERSMDRAQPTSPLQSPSASPHYTARATSATHEHHFQIAQNRLAPGLRERGLDREEIERVSAAAVFQAEQHAGRGGIQGVYLSKDGQRVAVRQEVPPISEFSVNTALTQTKDQHLERAHIVAHTQTQIHIPTETRQEQGRNQDAAPSSFSTQHMAAASPAAAETPARAMA